MCDMLWSDPCEKDDEAIGMGFVTNNTRGCSYVFGNKAATPFLQKNAMIYALRKFLLVMRNHYQCFMWTLAEGVYDILNQGTVL